MLKTYLMSNTIQIRAILLQILQVRLLRLSGH